MIHAEIKGVPLHFKTLDTLFAPNEIDRGTLAMLSAVDFTKQDKVLDLGCGYGVVGILAAKIIGSAGVVLSDSSPAAVECARENAALNGVPDLKICESDGFKSLNDKDFTLILSNPPYHADFSVPKEFIEKGFNRLAIEGRMVLVTKRKDWYKNKLISIFGGVRISEIDGYFVFMAMKKSASYAGAKLIKHPHAKQS